MIKFFIIALTILSFTLNGADLKSFPFYKEARTKRTNQRAVSAITLDSGIYSKTPNLCSGLRITGENNQEIPFALRQVFVKESYDYQNISSSSIESLQRIDNTVVLTVKQGKDILSINYIKLKTPTKNFEKSISIAVSNDNKLWNIIVANKAIFDYSSIIPLHKTEIQIPRSKYKYFRITINNFNEEKTSPIRRLVKEKQSGISLKEISSVIKRKTYLKINAVTLISLSKHKSNLRFKKQNYPVKISNITTKKKRTIVELNSDSEPLSELRISSLSTNFSRQLSLKGSNDKKNWRVITKKNWAKSNIFNKSVNNNKISFSEQRYKFYRIIIQNGDNPILKGIKVNACGNIYRIIMLGKQALELKLYYGASAPYPQYEIAGILPSVMDFEEIDYKLSREKVNPSFDGSIHSKQVNYKWLFIMIIVFISIILIFILYKNLGKLNNIEKSETKTE